MKEQKYNIFRVSGLLLTLAIFLGHYLVPEKHVVIHPSSTSETKLYGYIAPKTGQSSTWINRNENSMQCNYEADNKFGCGIIAFQTSDDSAGIDLTSYDAMLYDINYEGPSKRIRVYLRNHNDAYSPNGNEENTKFLSMILDVTEIGDKPIHINLSEFTVAEWWINQKKSRRKFTHYEINNIVNFGVDYVDPGLHKIRLNRITLTGRYIKTKTLLYCILLFWMGIFLLEGIYKFFSLYKKSQGDRLTIEKLRNNQLTLEIEREKLKRISSSDPLTGAYNRPGLIQYIQESIAHSKTTPEFGILLLDIDHFKKINDNYGHDIGDSVLKKFARIISLNMRENDIFARWGGEEFIIVTPKTSPKKLMYFSDKLRESVKEESFSQDVDLNITISIGATIVKNGNPFEDALKHADNALYTAKNNGRNCSIYEESN